MVIARAEQRLCGCYKGQQEFHKVLDLEDEGLVIYCHSLCREAKVTQGGVVGSKAHATQDVCVILHNTTDVKLKPADIIPALEKKDISCPRCRLLFEHAQNLLRNVKSIDKQNVTGVCDHCLKKAQSKKQCELCEQAVRKYLTMRDVKREEMKRYIKLWLSKMKHIVKDAVAEKSRKDKPRAYSDLQINELCQLSPRATRQLEVKQMFPSELRKSDSNLNANLLDLADDEKQMKKAVVFDESMEPLILAPYQTGVIDVYRHDKSDITVAGSDSVTQIKPVKPIKPIIHEIPKVAPWEQKTHKVDDDISVIKEVTVKLKREPSSKVVTPHDSSGISVKATSSTHVKVTPKKRHLTPESDSEKHDIATPELGEPKRKKIKVSEEKESTTHIKATKRKRVTEGEAEHPYSEQYKQEKDEYSKMKKKARESEALPKTLKRLEDSHLTDDEVKLQQKIPKLSHETEKSEKELEKKTAIKSKKPKIEQDTVENILQKQFSYFFPKSMEKQAKKPPKIGAPSSQLIRATHEKIRQQAEEEKKRHEQERQKKLEEKEKKRLEKEEKKRLAEEQKKEAREQQKEAREQQKEAREQRRHAETQKQAVPDAERKTRVAEEGDLTKKDLAKELLKSRVTSKPESKSKTSVKDRSEESEKPIKDLKTGLKDKDQETEKVKIESRIKAEPKSKTDFKDKGELIDKAKKDGKVKSERFEETESAKGEVRGKATSREEFESGKREPRGRAASREETESGKRERRGRAASKDETESGKREPRGRAASKDETESRKREPRGKTASREEIESGKREPRGRAASKDEKESPKREPRGRAASREETESGKREPRGKAAPREETESGKRELRGRAASREETETGKRERRGRAASKDETESPKRERRGRAASKDEMESPKRERRGRAASKDEMESPKREPRGRAASREETESGKRDKSGLKEKEEYESATKDLRTKQQKDKIDKSPEKSPRSKSDMKDKDVEKSQKEKGKQDREVKEAVPKKKRDSKSDAEAIDFAKMKLEKGDLSEHAASIKTAPKDKSKDVSAKVADTRKTTEVSKGKTKEASKDKVPSSKEAASKEKPLDFKGMKLDKGELSQPAISVKDKSKDVSVKASDKPKAKDGSKDKSKEVSKDKGLSLKSKEKSLDFKGMKLDTGAGLVPPVSMGAGIKEKPKDITVKPPDLPPKESTKEKTPLKKEEKQPVKKEEKASKGQQEKIPKGKEETKEEKSKKPKEDPEEALFRKLQAERLKEKEEEKKLLKKEEAEAQKARALAEKKAKEAAEKATTKIREAKATPRPEPPRPPPKPKLEPKRVDEPAIEVKMNQVKVYNSSADDLILRLVKIKQTALQLKCRERPYKIDASRIKAHRSRHEIGSVDISTCELCKDSELEIDVDSYENNANIPSDMEIIIGEKIYKYKAPILELGLEDENEIIPILFKSSFEVEPLLTPQSMPAKHEIVEEPQKKSKESKGVDPDQGKGIIRYALSDRTFIDKGWTMLPTEKVVRKMNVYRMRPAHPEFDWFEHNKNKRLMTYDTGERLAEFDDNGRGRWYYRNGRLALDYYDAEETNAQQRFVIYSSGEPDERGRSHPITILATFDYLGNGIVFDHAGKIRLKYNQTEGVVLDRGIGPVSHWKWHTLNDPPVLQQVMIDTQMAHKDPQIIKLGSAADNKVRPDNEEMLAIEFDNFIKEKSKKLSQKFKPFQIKMKALKINEHFSLKVLDQATVYLIFRDGSTNLKLNIGMILDHQEIVDTDTAEVGEVSNNLERFPARTDSLAGLQRSVAYAQRYERTRTERERRLRPPEPCGSADQLIAAASAPLRIPLRTVPTGTTSSVANCRCRKPTNNLYYNTRLL